jgi:heme/copper-type cytochrome/quinol oxidase subunit 2
MKKIIVVLVVLVLIFAALKYIRSQSTVKLMPNQQTNQTREIVATLYTPFDYKNHKITVWAVTEDSRCASDVQCIQAGRVRVALNVVSPSGPSITEMEPGGVYTTETLSIKLDKVEPYPISTHKTADSEYRFYFTISDK